MNIPLLPGDALIVVDVQNDFLPGGSLAVPRGDDVIPVLNRYLALFLSRRLPVEYAGSPRRKRSEGKATWPGRKQMPPLRP